MTYQFEKEKQWIWHPNCWYFVHILNTVIERLNITNEIPFILQTFKYSSWIQAELPPKGPYKITYLHWIIKFKNEFLPLPLLYVCLFVCRSNIAKGLTSFNLNNVTSDYTSSEFVGWVTHWHKHYGEKKLFAALMSPNNIWKHLAR